MLLDFEFQCGVLRWMARLYAYHASLVDQYPPFALRMGVDEAVPPATVASHAH